MTLMHLFNLYYSFPIIFLLYREESGLQPTTIKTDIELSNYQNRAHLVLGGFKNGFLFYRNINNIV